MMQTEEWRKATMLEAVTTRELMKAYYREAEEEQEPAVDTDSMASARSRSGEELAKLRAKLAEAKAQLASRGSGSKPLLVPGPRLDEEEYEDDDEDDRDSRMLKNLEAETAVFRPGGADPPPIGGKEQSEWAQLLADDSGKQRCKELAAHPLPVDGGRTEPSGGEQDSFDKMMQAMMPKMIMKSEKDDDVEGTGTGSSGRAFKLMHAARGRPLREPHRVEIDWDKMKGIQRCHFNAAQALALGMRGEHVKARAYMVQLLPALRQVSIDDGGWDTAALPLPKVDLVSLERFEETIKKLKKERGKGAGKDGKGKGAKADGEE